MMARPSVSVIIPTYNRAQFVCRAIDSVLAQTYNNMELIVVDDGSTDDTLSVLRKYGSQIQVLTQPNRGPSIARNHGLSIATRDIVAFLDSDDYWLPSKLAYQVELLERAGEQVVCCLCNCTINYSDGSRTSSFAIADMMPGRSAGLWLNPADVLLTRPVIFTQAAAIRRSALTQIGGFSPSLPLYCEDYDLSVGLALLGPWVILRDELVVCQDASPGSLGQQALRDEIRLRENLLEVWNRAAIRIQQDPRHSRFRRAVRRGTRGAQRELTAARLMHLGVASAKPVALMLRFMERVRRGLFRRSPVYPRLVIQPIE